MSKVQADIEALKFLQHALGTFTEQQQQVMEMVRGEIDHTMGLLNEVERHWRYKVLRRTQALITGLPDIAETLEGAEDLFSAEDDLYYIESQAEYAQADEIMGLIEGVMAFVPGLSSIRQAYRLHQAATKLMEVQRWQREVRETVEWYYFQAQRLADMLGTELPRANIYMENRITALEAYYASQIVGATMDIIIPDDAQLLSTVAVDHALDTDYGTIGDIIQQAEVGIY